MLYEGKYSLKRSLLREAGEPNDVQGRVKSGTVAENLARLHFGLPLLATNVGPGEADLPTSQGTFECKSGKDIAAEITNSAPHGMEMKKLARALGGKSQGAQQAVSTGWSEHKDADGKQIYASEADYRQKVADWYVNSKSADGVVMVTGAMQVVKALEAEFGVGAWKSATEEQLREKAMAAKCTVNMAMFEPGKFNVIGVSSYGEATTGTRIKIIIRPSNIKLLKQF